MSKIKPVQIFTDQGYLYVIDDEGLIWKKSVPNGTWTSAGELPEKRKENSTFRIRTA